MAVIGALVVSVAGYTAPAGAASAARTPQQVGPVSPTAALGTPELTKTGSSQDSIRQMVQCGDTMYAVGHFPSITQGGVAYPRTNVFSFSAIAPYTITSWSPDVNGDVNSIAFNGTDCADAYIGGDFTNVSGTAVENIAEIDTTTGAVDPTFGTDATNQVETLLAVGGHLLVGGYFGRINGTKDPFMASVSPVTGDDDGFLHLNISGTYSYCTPGGGPCTSSGNRSMVYNQQLSHGGTLDLVEGRFTSVGGQQREQIFMLNLATDPATVTGWTSPEFDGSNPSYPYQCYVSEAFYVRSAAWSPDDSTVYLATTGYHPNGLPTGNSPRSGDCDAAIAFPATQTSVLHTWITYTGCDSYYSVSADDGAVYVAGHPRWTENPNGCDFQGPGAVPDKGLQGLNPSTGEVEMNSADTGPLYTMTRANADNMLITDAGLWISSTNRYTVNDCGNATGKTAGGHAGICFLPYTS